MKMKPIDFSIVDNPNEFTYSKKRHFEMLKNAALEYMASRSIRRPAI